jgi:hypothetical protein
MTIFSFALAEEETTTKRGQELNSANSLTIILLMIIVGALSVYFSIELTANNKINKMFNKASKAVKKAFHLVSEFEKEEREEQNEELLRKLKEKKRREEVTLPRIKSKSILQKKLQIKRKKINKEKKKQILSEFEENSHNLTNHDSSYLKKPRKHRDDIFLKLNNLSKNKKN